MLDVRGLSAWYGNLQVLWDVSLHVDEGEIVTLLGANGAGKTTLVQGIFGFIPKVAGSISFGGKEITGLPPYEVVRFGLALVPERRELFPKMTVGENLELGAHLRGKDGGKADRIFSLFPVLSERKDQLAGTLSGGEQQMLAIGRSLMSGPKLLVLDEPSLGLSPLFVTSVLDTVKALNGTGLTILLVEQNVQHALEISDRGYILENGRVTHEGPAQDLLADEKVQEAYLGM
ncbi:MAG TPA: ABC transporter ATP-binding protein [Methanomicrobiales archaeon]|nr:ABC transporter ATP-binding protein [Methanomicrobiales archaeon]